MSMSMSSRSALEAFKQATLANARESLKEPGVARFDVVQQQDDPARFVLVEVYRDANAAAAHKETKHYPVWRDAVASMMAESRFSVKFSNLFPEDAGWSSGRASGRRPAFQCIMTFETMNAVKFEFTTATRILFGAGAINDAGAIAGNWVHARWW